MESYSVCPSMTALFHLAWTTDFDSLHSGVPHWRHGLIWVYSQMDNLRSYLMGCIHKAPALGRDALSQCIFRRNGSLSLLMMISLPMNVYGFKQQNQNFRCVFSCHFCDKEHTTLGQEDFRIPGPSLSLLLCNGRTHSAGWFGPTLVAFTERCRICLSS